jgi:hypothetical protein
VDVFWRLPKVLAFYFLLPWWERAGVRGDKKKLLAISIKILDVIWSQN